jgi:transcriptional regulator with XRE-family HTH domain
MAFGKEIKRLRDIHNISAQTLADAIGIDAERLRSWEKKDLNPREDDTVAIEKYFDLPIIKFKSLEKLPKVPSKEEARSAKEAFIEKRNGLKERGEAKKGIRIFESAPVQAGFNPSYHDDPENQVPDYVLRIPQFRDCTYGTRASGDSMYPEVRNGDLVFCKELVPSARIIYGDMYVVHTIDGVETIKYIQQYIADENEGHWVLLVPHNKAAGMGTPIPRKEIRRLFKVRAIFKGY